MDVKKKLPFRTLCADSGDHFNENISAENSQDPDWNFLHKLKDSLIYMGMLRQK
jgi:hypothetical protein